MRRSLSLLAGLALAGSLLSPLLPSAGAAEPSAATATATAAAPGTGTITTERAGGLGYDRLTIRRADTWYLQSDLDGGAYTRYVQETGGYQPIAGDTDGDGSDSLSLFRDGVWLIRNSRTGPRHVVGFGMRGDVPVLGDWNGDGIDTVGLFRRGKWFLRDSNTGGTRTFGYGMPGDQPVVGDWNGDGRTDIGVVRNSVWYQRDAANAGATSRTFRFGNIGDRRFAGDWDHDGRDSPGVFRNGTWYLRQSSNPTSPYTMTAFGRSGDTPLVRRTAGLAPGVSHRVIHDPNGPVTVHVATIDLAAASTPDAVLSNGTLQGLETTTSMARRSGAVLAVNGDYFESNGRPVHAFAADGRLAQTPQLNGRALSIDATGTTVHMGRPDTRAAFTVQTATGTATIGIPRWNSGRADSDTAAAYTSAGKGLETPPDGDCYAGLAIAGSPTSHPDGGVDTPMSVTGSRCDGPAPVVPPGVMLDGSRFNPSGSFLDALYRGQSGVLSTNLGFPGAVDVIGGTPVLIAGGAIQWQDLTGSDPFFGRQPRTAVGVTSDGKMLLVVVDGRQPGYSVGMSLAELAELMNTLGARDAFNLDGGGSSAMYVNGQRVNRPSDRYERGVGSALVVLPGADPGQANLAVAPPGTVPAYARAERAPAPTQQPLVSPVVGGTPVAGWLAAAQDAGSIGGLSAALADQGVSLPPDLQRAQTVFDSSR